MNINDTLKKIGIKPGEHVTGRNVVGMGLDQRNMEQARFLEDNGFKVKGTLFNSVIGTTQIDIKLSGTAKILLGFKIVNNYTLGGGAALNPEATLTLKVNNSILIEGAPVEAFCCNVTNNVCVSYFEFVRMLNGSDNINILLTDTAANKYNIYFYYI